MFFVHCLISRQASVSTFTVAAHAVFVIPVAWCMQQEDEACLSLGHCTVV